MGIQSFGGGSSTLYLIHQTCIDRGWLGEDEFAHALKNGPYKGLLVAATKLSVRFKDGNSLVPAPPAWVTATAYVVADAVAFSGKFYSCIVAHTSGVFADDLAANKWAELQLGGGLTPYAGGTNYNKFAFVKEGGSYYSCNVTHTSGGIAGDVAANKWVETGASKGNWSTPTIYAVKDLVKESDKYYVCSTAHTSGVFADDLRDGKWAAATNGRGAWQASTAYALGDWVTDGGKNYACRTVHTGGSFATDLAAGKWVKASSRPGIWLATQKQDWLGDFNKDLVTMLEGSEGKFRFAATDANHDFANTYLRVFPQYEIVAPAAAATAGTHFKLEITLDNTTSFTPAGSDVKVGNNCANNTMIRYLYGLISDNAITRASQDLTTAMTKNDLGKLKDWIKAQAGGDFTVEDI